MDPTGLNEEDQVTEDSQKSETELSVPDLVRSMIDIRNDIASFQSQYRDIAEGPLYDTEAAKEQLFILRNLLTDLFGEYNQAIINDADFSIEDFIDNGYLTSGFDKKQDLTGNYQNNGHTGVDGLGGAARSPFYTRLFAADVGPLNIAKLEILGTDLALEIFHGDKGTINPTAGGMFAPGQPIMPFPKFNNDPNSSTGPHFHFQIGGGGAFFNPFTMRPSMKVFKYTYDGGNSWRNNRVPLQSRE